MNQALQDVIERRRTTNVFEANHTISDEQIEPATLSMATISTLVQARPYRELVYREKQLHVGRASRVKREEPGEHVPYARELTKSEAPLRGRSTHRQISGFAVVVPTVAFRSISAGVS